MIPQTPSSNVAPDSSAEKLLRLGAPFVDFPRYSILDIQRERNYDGTPVPFSEWLTRHLQAGKPFVIQDFDKLDTWPRAPAASVQTEGATSNFTLDRLIELSTKKNIPIRNCSTGRDLQFTLSKFVESARQSFPEFQNLYARDLPCPQEWLQQCRALLPPEVQWSGRQDLFQWLPQCARSEVMMAYVGSEGSCSGFHRCFSSTVALNFLIDTEDDRPVVCIGTDFESQQRYDNFMTTRGISPHLDWHNLGVEEMLQADFPLYVYDQRLGDLVVFGPATAHQIWNPPRLTTKLVWNTLHPLSLEVGIKHVQLPFNRLCHPDVARVNLSLAYAMLSLIDKSHDYSPRGTPPDLPLLSKLFRQMVQEEKIESPDGVPQIQFVTLTPDTIATCNFCGTGIWNRHVRCTVCADFDLCLLCYLNGRSCEHTQSYVWGELVTLDTCNLIMKTARETLGYQPEEIMTPDRCKTLGTAVNDLMRAKESQASRLCHLCRIDHPEWKGRRCDSCTAFFCYRGLFRHFDIQPTEVLRHSGFWQCPKCDEICNCRCCHFSTAYVKSEKPASKRRVKASDPRGKTMGFADNVFDQKRGGKRDSGSGAASGAATAVATVAGKKRSIEPHGHEGPLTPLRKTEASAEDHFGRTFMSREGSEFSMSTPFSSALYPPLLPSVKSVAEASMMMSTSSANGQRSPMRTMQYGHTTTNTLPPMLSRSMYSSPYPDKSLYIHEPHNTSTPRQAAPRPPALSYLSTVTNSEPQTSAESPTVSQSTRPTDAMSVSTSTITSPRIQSEILEHQISALEAKIHTLKAYDEEFAVLKLADSRKELRRQIQDLEAQLEARKKAKGLDLIQRLKQQGFIKLADSVGIEVGMLGNVSAQVQVQTQAHANTHAHTHGHARMHSGGSGGGGSGGNNSSDIGLGIGQGMPNG